MSGLPSLRCVRGCRSPGFVACCVEAPEAGGPPAPPAAGPDVRVRCPPPEVVVCCGGPPAAGIPPEPAMTGSGDEALSAPFVGGGDAGLDVAGAGDCWSPTGIVIAGADAPT